MAERHEAEHLDPETIAAYIDGRLPAAERAMVEAAIAADPELYEWVVNAVNAVADLSIVEPTDVNQRAPRFGRTLATLLGAAAALLLVVWVQPAWWRDLRTPEPDGRLARLVDAVGNTRYTEARLTGGFRHGPLQRVLRGPNDLSQQNLQLLAAAGELQKLAQQRPGAAQLHAWGVAQTLLGDLDGAIDTLDLALQLEPQSASVLTDRGSALLTRAERDQSDEDLPAAGDAFERALAIEPTLPEARFGRALALERLGFTESARESWRKYLDLDATSPWADDARARLLRLEGTDRAPDLRGLLERFSLDPGLASNAQSVRELVEDSLVVSWMEPPSPADAPRPNELRDLIAEIGRVQRDATLVDTFEPVARAVDLPRRRAILEGFRCHAQMRRAYLDFESTALLVLSERCRRLFADAGVPFQHWSSVYLARALQSAGRLDESRVATDTVLASVDRNRYPLVHAWALLQQGALRYRAGAAATALQPLTTAHAVFVANGEAERAAGAADILASIYRNVGDVRHQWRSVRQAQSSQPSRPATIRWHATRTSGVNYAIESGYSHLASTVLQTLLAAAEASGVAGRIAESAIQLARIHAERGDTASAFAQATVARTAVATIGDAAVARPLEAALALYEAEYGSPGDAGRTAASVRAARERLALVNDHTRMLTLARLELQAAVSAGQHARTDALIAAGLDLIRQQGSLITAPAERAKFNATTVAFTNVAATHHVETGRPELALPLLDVAAQTSAGDGGTSVTGVPEGDAIIVFRSAPSELWRWCITARSTTFARLPLSAATVRQALAEVRATLQASAAPDATVLETVLDGLPDDVHAARRWVFVVRDFPAGFPAAALPLERGVMVADRHECVFASSVAAYLRRAAEAGDRPALPRVQVVSGPTDGTFGAPRLASGARESQLIAGMHQADIVTGTRATVEAFTRALRDADIVHFVGHAAASRRGSLESYLVLAPSPAHPLGLLTGDIAARQRFTTDTLILASCSSAEPSPASTAFETLASAFSAAGVRQVVGTLWAVADDDADDVFVALHELLRKGIGVPESVRQVQTRFRDERRPGHVWASLAVIVA